jgi:hypothetical protein
VKYVFERAYKNFRFHILGTKSEDLVGVCTNRSFLKNCPFWLFLSKDPGWKNITYDKLSVLALDLERAICLKQQLGQRG